MFALCSWERDHTRHEGLYWDHNLYACGRDLTTCFGDVMRNVGTLPEHGLPTSPGRCSSTLALIHGALLSAAHIDMQTA